MDQKRQLSGHEEILIGVKKSVYESALIISDFLVPYFFWSEAKTGFFGSSTLAKLSSGLKKTESSLLPIFYKYKLKDF
jgi:hypothetical protein